ncbi:hypothetical protein FQA39_LY14687 [Lamprigera yunnana]|nr:hypothetical protein FQA39_LY14687 [Lamprigera yunnana]
MSFGLPSIKVKSSLSHELILDDNNYCVNSLLTAGFSSSEYVETSHPLILPERNYHKNRHQMNMAILRNVQGLHAPLKMSMEVRSIKQVGRLPFLPPSNALLDSLSGRDLEIGPEDIFNTPEFREVVGQPHAILEKSLQIL